jgi:outer membrane biosynthesis protein TonB
MSTPVSPELIRLKRQAAKRFHPDNAIDAEDGARLTRLMQEANAAFDARDEERLRAVFAPPQPPPPQAPPNAWKPRSYPGAQEPTQPPPQQPRAQQTQQQPPKAAQSAQVSESFTAWFWITWGGWSVVCLVVNNPWMIVLGFFASIFIASYLEKFQRAIERTFAKKTPRQATSGQAVPSGPRYPGWHPWFWGTWISCSVLGLAIGQIGKTGTTLNDTATFTGIWYFLGGIPLAFVLAWFRDRIKHWLAAQHTAGSQGKLGHLAGLILFFILVTMLPVMSSPIGVASHVSPSPAPAPGPVKVVPSHIVQGDIENGYIQGIIQTVGKNFLFATDRKYANPPKGTAVDMSFEVGPTGYHNAASIIKSSGDGGLDWACTQAVNNSPSFGYLPASAKGGNLLITYKCVFNESDSITKVVLIPAASTPPVAFSHAPPKPITSKQAFDGKFLAEGVGGVFTGTVHNNGGLDANITVVLTRQRTGALVGYFSVSAPLYGSGPLNGATVDNGLDFTVSPREYPYKLNFKGLFTGPASMRGTYTVSNGQGGTFTMHASDPAALQGRDRDTQMAEYETKSRALIQMLFETWPTASAPVGVSALAEVTVNGNGAPAGQATLVTPSGWGSG